MAGPKQVFLSHSRLDQRFVTRLARNMHRHGVPVWYRRTNILGAQQWHDEIGAALERSDWFCLVLSPNSIKSMWVKRELLFALQQNRFEDRIVPLVYRACDYERLSWVLSSFQRIDFRSGFEDGCRDLPRVWGLAYRPDTAS
jgi:hypothetical protein